MPYYRIKHFKLLCVSTVLAAIISVSPPAAAQVVNRVGILGTGQGCQWSTVGAAIAAASSVARSTILIETGQTFTEQLGTINKPVTIAAGNAACTALSIGGVKPVIDAANLGRVATISEDVTFQYVEIRNGEVTDQKGGNLLVTSGGHLILDDVLVADGVLNLSIAQIFKTYAAGIHVETGGTLVMRGTSSLFSNEVTQGWGVGGLVVEVGATATLEDTSRIGAVLAGNIGDDTVGGALVEGTMIMADDSEVSGNVADSTGGILISDGNVELRNRARVSFNFGNTGGILVYEGGQLTTGLGAIPMIENNVGDLLAGGISIAGNAVNNAFVDLGGISISSNTSNGCGAGLYIDDALGSVSLEAAILEANQADGCGGGIALFAGELTMDDVEIIANQAGTDGGGLYLDGTGSDVVATATRIDSNSSAARGGGVAQLAGASLALHDSDVTSNSAGTDGGGVFVDGPASILSADEGSISRNSATRGAGLYADKGTTTLDYQKINSNDALSEAGGIRVTAGATVHVHFGEMNRNTAGTMGGAFAVPGGRLNLLATNVFSNEAGTDGGAGAITRNGFVTAQNVWFHSNQAMGRGGGLAVLAFEDMSNPRLVVDGDWNQDGCMARSVYFNEYCSEFRENHATGSGGAIFAEDGTITIAKSGFLANTAGGQGSAVLLQDNGASIPHLIAINDLFAGNGLDPTKDIVRVAAGSLIGTHLTSADNNGIPFHFGPNGAGGLLWSIVWDTANVLVEAPAGAAATCSMFRAWTGILTGVNFVGMLDPFFVTTARGDYRLDALVSINAVDKCEIGAPEDLDGHLRPDGPLTRWDRGAFEAP